MREPSPRFWQRRRVFVTGATGLLGSHLVQQLLDMNAEVVALLRDTVPRSLFAVAGMAERVTVVRGSVTDEPLLRRILVEYEVQTTFHLAAQTLVTHAYNNPVETFDVNVGGTCRLLEACRVYGACTEVIVAASDKAYGQQDQLPYTEASPMQGSYPYDASKSCADLIARCYATTYGLPVAVTRLANLFGPGDLNFNRIIPGTIRSVLLGEPIVVRSDGTPRREYVFVGDGARAYLIVAEDLQSKGLAGEAFNFGLGYPLTVLEVVNAIKQAAGKPDIMVDVRGEAKAEIDAQWMDSTKARTQLSWEPRWSFERGLAQTVPWYRERVGGS
jgi:CDP-glucose 4,6-dehydratase